MTGSRRTLLIAVDHPAVRHALTDALRTSRHHLIVATDVEDALEQAQRLERLDLLIVGVRFDERSGSALARAVRECQDAVPVLFLTGDPATVSDPPAPTWAVLCAPFQASAARARIEALLRESPSGTGQRPRRGRSG